MAYPVIFLFLFFGSFSCSKIYQRTDFENQIEDVSDSENYEDQPFENQIIEEENDDSIMPDDQLDSDDMNTPIEDPEQSIYDLPIDQIDPDIDKSDTIQIENGENTIFVNNIIVKEEPMILLPMPVFTKNVDPWYVVGMTNEDRFSIFPNQLVLNYVPHKNGMDSGAGFHANPHKIFPRDSATFQYDVYFPKEFDWVKGGKLPGICFGIEETSCATGGDWQDDAGSFRVMWRETGVAIGYSYHAIAGGAARGYDIQGTSYKAVSERTASAGHNLWKKIDHPMKFKKGWNTVKMTISLNTPGIKNGVIELTINGKSKKLTKVIMRERETVKLNQIDFVSFFGGGDDSWNSPIKTYTKFKNIYIFGH